MCLYKLKKVIENHLFRHMMRTDHLSFIRIRNIICMAIFFLIVNIPEIFPRNISHFISSICNYLSDIRISLEIFLINEILLQYQSLILNLVFTRRSYVFGCIKAKLSTIFLFIFLPFFKVMFVQLR